MAAIADFWVSLSPDTQALVQGALLMLLLQAYKWLGQRISWLPALKDAEPRMKQFVVAVTAFLFAVATMPEQGSSLEALIRAWLEHMGGAIGSHQVLTAYINQPIAERRAEAND